jgi:hypothetical protein
MLTVLRGASTLVTNCHCGTKSWSHKTLCLISLLPGAPTRWSSECTVQTSFVIFLLYLTCSRFELNTWKRFCGSMPRQLVFLRIITNLIVHSFFIDCGVMFMVLCPVQLNYCLLLSIQIWIQATKL